MLRAFIYYRFVIYLGIMSILVNISPCLAQDDIYLEGYLNSILEQKLNWQANSYYLEVTSGIASIFVSDATESQIMEATQAFSSVHGLVDFNFTKDGKGDKDRLPSYVHYPHGDYFKPIIADVKEPQFFISLLKTTSNNGNNFVLGSVGLGHTFGLYRWPKSIEQEGWQLDLFMALFSQFNMDTPSDDLLNSDYTVGIPFTFRYGRFSGRISYLHQSSHLGDELLLSDNPPERIDLSVELLDITLAQDIGSWRIMLGGKQLLSYGPSDLEDQSLHAAIDYRDPGPLFGNNRFIAGIYSNWLEENAWSANTSVKFGIEIGQSYPYRRGSRILIEAYKGAAPFGQFFRQNIEYYGFGLYFDID